MALSPKQIRELAPEDKKAADDLEAHIDCELRGNPGYGGSHRIGLSYPADTLRHLVQEELRRRYHIVGWNVSFNSDQRGGDMIELTEAETPGGTGEKPDMWGG